MRKLSEYVIERFIDKTNKPTTFIKTKEELYNYMFKKYNLKRKHDFQEKATCPKSIDLTEVSVPENFNAEELFMWFAGEEIDISTWKITDINKLMFYNAPNLKRIFIPNTVVNIQEQAFERCYDLTYVNIPNSIQTIKDNAFSDCRNLTLDIDTFPNSLTEIGQWTFHKCEKLQSKIVIPDSVTSIGNSAFASCKSIEKVVISNNMNKIASDVFYGCSKLTDVVISDSITEIGVRAFSWTNVNNIIIPNNVEKIGINTFLGCENLESITISDSVEIINNPIFDRCKKLKEIKTPKGNRDKLEKLLPEELHKYVKEV